jgi:hypothetical protein
LETDSLTVELTPLYFIEDCRFETADLKSTIKNRHLQLFHFLVRRMLPATVAEFLQFQPLGHGFTVLGLRVIAFFAITALHGNDFSGHCSLPFRQLVASGYQLSILEQLVWPGRGRRARHSTR